MEDVAAASAGRIGADFALAVQNRLGTAADHVVAAGVRLGRLLEARATPARVVVGDRMWLDGGPKVSQMADKLVKVYRMSKDGREIGQGREGVGRSWQFFPTLVPRRATGSKYMVLV
jgi:hypothetical protein